LTEADDELWAVAEFCPKLFDDSKDDCAIDAITALSVSSLRDMVRRDFLWMLIPLLLVGLFALLWGGRIADNLNETLERLLRGFRQLEAHSFETIEPMRTGNELEEIAHGFNHAVEGLRERDHLRMTFGEYMTESVVEHVLANEVELGGDDLRVTVLFTDIRGFTAMSEKLDAQQVVKLLNEYFTRTVDVIMEHGGVVDKYIGDALMVIFGAPVSTEHDSLNAVKAAVQMRSELAKRNAELMARGEAPIRTGIGLHTGDMVAVNIGSDRRKEYTVIGDAVNLASRLEGENKNLG
jgi:adenylate cyclase